VNSITRSAFDPSVAIENRRKEVENLTSRLTDSEKSKLIVLAESLVKKENIFALCVYGSRVAGYSAENSELEMIIVAKGFKEDLTVGHLHESLHSPLIIDEVALMKQATEPSYDEFAVSRLLNVYEPIINPEFLQGVEVEYKKRVIAEELIQIESDYDDFSSNLIIPYEYFLFDKLHKRALLYPQEVYSYASIYSCLQREENIKFTLRGFREAADSLSSGGILESTNESVRIFRGKQRMKAFFKILKIFPLTTRSSLRYAGHDFAHRLGFEFKTKPLSKLKITKEVELPIELDRPKKLLRLEDGVIFDDSSKMIEEIAQMSGFDKPFDYNDTKKGDFINSTRQLEIWDDKKREKYVLKDFPQLKAIKWVLLNLWSLIAKTFNMSPLSRLSREIEAVKRVRELGIKTHRIFGIDLDERTLVTEYVEGVPLSKFVEDVLKGKSTDASNIEKYGQVLGRLHKAGLVYGDTKPQNVLVGRDGINLLDLEQSEEGGDEAWDIAEFLYFSATHLEKEDGEKYDVKKLEVGMRLIADAFLTGYRSKNGSQMIAKAKSRRYLAPFRLFLARNMSGVVRDALERYSSPDCTSR